MLPAFSNCHVIAEFGQLNWPANLAGQMSDFFCIKFNVQLTRVFNREVIKSFYFYYFLHFRLKSNVFLIRSRCKKYLFSIKGKCAMEKVDSLNYLSIKVLEQLGNTQPSQAEIDWMETVLANDITSPWCQKNYCLS